MDMPSIPLKRCSRKDNCLHPEGQYLPETAGYFLPHKGGFYSQCHYCRKDAKRQSHLRNQESNSARHAKWREENQEHVRTYHKQRYADNPTPSRDRAAKWYGEHKEYVAQRDKLKRASDPEKYRLKNKQYRIRRADKIKAGIRAWRAKNRERHNRSNREWDKRHPVEARAKSARRRALKRNAPGSYTAEDVALILKSQNRRCWWCGNMLDESFHVDHRIPLSRGGSNHPENLCISCHSCNESKGGKLPHEWTDRLL